jgi:hypothetical protein
MAADSADKLKRTGYWSELKNSLSLSHTHTHMRTHTHHTHNQPCASLNSLGLGAIRSYMTVGLTLLISISITFSSIRNEKTMFHQQSVPSFFVAFMLA